MTKKFNRMRRGDPNDKHYKLEKMLEGMLSEKEEQIKELDSEIESILSKMPPGIVVNAMYVPKEEYSESIFDELPTIPGVRNIKVIIEED